MLDRQDIDALLIGSLYGELTPAEQTALTAHLESHPTDRTALADLQQARAAVRESRILSVQLDPPQSVSALLMQEAARRAPRKPAEASEGWFQRFMRSFVAHPAMAAAAMLVLVIGVAGTMYMKRGVGSAVPAAPPAQAVAAENAAAADKASLESEHGESAKQSDQLALAQSPVAAPTAMADPKGGMPSTGAQEGAGSAYRVNLDDGIAARDEKVVASAPAHAARPDSAHGFQGDGAGAPAGKKKAPGNYIQLNKEEPSPKDLPDREQAYATPPAKDLDSIGGERARGGAFGSATGTSADANGAPAKNQKADLKADRSTTAAVPTPAPSKTVAMPPPPPPASQAPAPTTPAADKGKDTQATWAKTQHERVVAAVRANNCREAAQIASTIRSRAPEYYAASVVSDIDVKPCLAYFAGAIDGDRDKPAAAKSESRSETTK